MRSICQSLTRTARARVSHLEPVTLSARRVCLCHTGASVERAAECWCLAQQTVRARLMARPSSHGRASHVPEKGRRGVRYVLTKS